MPGAAELSQSTSTRLTIRPAGRLRAVEPVERRHAVGFLASRAARRRPRPVPAGAANAARGGRRRRGRRGATPARDALAEIGVARSRRGRDGSEHAGDQRRRGDRADGDDAPTTRVLVLSASNQDADVMDAIMAGACGYLLKDSSIHDLVTGIRAAANGESLISPAIAVEGSRAAAGGEPCRARGGGRRALRPRDAGSAPDRERQRQRPDRRRAAHQPEDGQEPHLEHPDEAPDREPDPGGGLRRPFRARLRPPNSGVRLPPSAASTRGPSRACLTEPCPGDCPSI